MAMGKAIVPTLTGAPDFPGDKHAITLSANGPGRLMQCWKCPSCGHSFYTGQTIHQ